MAVELATAYVSIIPSTKGLGTAVTKELGKVDTAAGKTGQSMGRKLSTGIGKTLKAGALTAGAAAGGILATALTKGFGRLSAIDEAKAKLKGLGNSAQAIEKIMTNANAAVKGTAFGLDEAATTAAAAVAAGIKPGRELERTLTVVADTAAIAGTSMSDMGAIFNSVAARGKLQGDDLLQLVSRGVPVLQFLAEETGKTSAEISDMVSKGQIDFETFQAAMERGLGGSAQAMGKTFKGAFANMNAALGRFGATLLTPVFAAAPPVFAAITAGLDTLTKAIRPAMDALAADLAPRMQALMESIPKLWGRLTASVAPHLEEFRARVGAMWDSLSAGSIDTRAWTAFGDILGTIGEILANVGPELLQIGQTAAQAAAQVSAETWSALAKTFEALAPVIQHVAEVLADHPALVAGFVTAWLGMRTIGTVTAPLRGVAGVLLSLSRIFVIAKFGSEMSKLASATKTTNPALSSFAKMSSRVAKTMTPFRTALRFIVSPFKTLVGLLGKGFVKTLGLVARGFRALGAAMAANPLGALIVAISAVVAGLVWFFTETETGRKLWADFTEFMSNAWNTVKEKLSEAWAAITTAAANAREAISEKWNGITEWFQEKWAGVTEFFTGLWARITETVSGAWETIKERITTAWTTIVTWVQEAWTSFTTWVGEVWAGIKERVAGAWEAITTRITAAWTTIVTWVQEAWATFTTWVGEVWTGIKERVAGAWEAITGRITAAWNAIVAWVQQAWASFTQFVQDTWNTIKERISAAWENIKARISAAWETIKTYISTKWEEFKAYVQATWQAVKDKIAAAWNQVKEKTRAAWEAIKNKISQVWDNIKSKVASSVQNIIARLADFVNGVRAKFNAAVQKIREFPGKLRAVFANAGRWLIDAGRRIIDGLINGIKSMAGSIGNAIKSILPAGVRGFIQFAGGGVAYADGGVARFARGATTRRTTRGVRSIDHAPVGGERHVAQIARAGEWRLWAEPETGGEAYIPLARSKRRRSTAILADVAGHFGLNLTDKAGRAVSSFTPGGTGPLAEGRAFANGGVRTAKQVRDFVEGRQVCGAQASRSLQGAPYVFGGSNWGDCSATQSAIAAFMLGLNPFPRKFATMDQETWLRNNGAHIGRGPEGTYRVGWYNGGQWGGHTSGTLPDGTNVEMGGGGPRGGKIGGAAAAWNSPQFTNFAWIPTMEPVKPVASPDLISGEVGGGSAPLPPAPAGGYDDEVYPDAAGTGTGSVTAGGDDNIVPLDDDVAAQARQAGLDEHAADVSKPSSSLAGAPDTWSDLAGSVVAGFVSGQIKDLLNVFGIPDQVPPLLKAGRDLFVRIMDGDPEGRKANEQVSDASEAIIAAGGPEAVQPAEDTVPGAVTPAVPAPATPAAIPTGTVGENTGEVEHVDPVNIGQVTKGPYQLGSDFYAEELARAVAERKMGFQAAKIAYATMLVETGDPPRMFASSVDTASQDYPHDAVGSDHDSSGLFQQRANGAWGDVSQRMNARASAAMFLNALAKVPGWDTMDPGQAAQAVQRSAFPSRYSAKMDRAEQVMSAYKKRFGLKKGGLVRGGRKGFDDILAFLSDGEMVVNATSVGKDPAMARTLNEDGPDGVRDLVLSDAAGDIGNAVAKAAEPPRIAGGSPQQIVDALLYGGAEKVGPTVAAVTKAGFDLAGRGAQAAVSAGLGAGDSAFTAMGVPLGLPLNTLLPGAGNLPGALGGLAGASSLSEIGDLLPIQEGIGVVGDVASWYAGEVSGGIANAFAQWGSTVFGIGMGGVEDLLAGLGGPNPADMQLPMTAGAREFTDVLEASAVNREAEYRQRTGTEGQVVNNFIAQDTSAMWQRFRVEQAKANRGKVGAR